MTSWVRLWMDMPSDPKWRLIAADAGASISEVIAVFNFMLICAGLNEPNVTANGTNVRERGVLKNWDDRVCAAGLNLDVQNVTDIRCAMEDIVIRNNILIGWEKRQPLREDSTGAERARKWREKQKTLRNDSRTYEPEHNAPESESESEKKRRARVREAPSEVAPTLAPRKKGPGGRINGHAANEDALMVTKFTPAELERHQGTHKIYVKRETPAGEAWAEWARKNTGRSQVWDAKGGWHFPSEWPPPSPSES